MNVKKFLLMPALCVAAAAFGQQALPTLTYRVESTSKDPVDSANTKATYRFRVMEKLPGNLLRVEVTLKEYFQASRYSPFNSAAVLENNITSSLSLMMALLLEQPVELTFDPAVRGISPQPALVAAFREKARALEVQQKTIDIMVPNLDFFARNELRNAFLQIPANTTRWQSADSVMLYSVKGAPGGMRTITGLRNPAKETPGITSVAHEAFTWDDAAGKMLHITTAHNNKVTAPAQGGGQAPFRTVNKTDMRLLTDTVQAPPTLAAQIEMTVKLSSWSNAIKESEASYNTDSAKAMALLQQYEPLLGHTRGYALKKLSLLQQISGKNYDLYDKALKATPSHLLEGASSHLHNKLQGVRHQDVDSAMQLIHLLAAASPREFESWMQHSMAQSLFIESSEADMKEATAHWRSAGVSEERIAELLLEAKEMGPKSAALIHRMQASRDTVVRNAAMPMYLGHRAAQATHPDSLRSIARRFGALTPAQRTGGNADRYGLMLYKHMKEKGMPADAEAVLKATLASLQQNTADTLSKTRYASQNMLAYAYYLQYQHAKESNNKSMMNYLAKASALSPRSPEEKAYDSFYDRVLLHSSESYRKEYLTALLKDGDKQEALLVLAQQINADPTLIPDAQQSFDEHFPQRNFADFIGNTVIKSWRAAPDFDLKGPDGTPYKLSDFRGKWLLLDFWGTWCGPCREELPQINAFAQSVKNSPTEAFFSIACYDSPEKVTAMLGNEGYTFSVGMSDNQVEKQYKVKGYPSKFIISPDGTMLPLVFSRNWQKAFELFSKTQASPAKTEKNLSIGSRVD